MDDRQSWEDADYGFDAYGSRPRRRWIIILVIVLVVAAGVVAYFLLRTKGEPPQPQKLPLEIAQEALKAGAGPDKALELAQKMPDDAKNADARFLLLEYAAEENRPEAALLVGRFYDPSYEGPSGSIKKNAQSAYDWYRQASEAGENKAADDLARLKQWLEKQAEQGDQDARKLLDQWR